MKKLLALVLALILVCGMLTACGDNAKSMLKKADAALQKAPYTMTVKMDFESDDAELDKIFSAVNMEIPVTVDGKNLAMDMNMGVSGNTVKAKITLVDMVMYFDMEAMGQRVKMKAAMDEDEYEEFMEESNTEMMVDPDDFGKLTVETKNGKKYIACGEISEEGLDELNEMMEDSLKATGGKATVSDVKYGVTLNDGKYESMELTCVYSVTVNGKTNNVTFKANMEYDYDDAAKVTVPADADTYKEADFDDIMN